MNRLFCFSELQQEGIELSKRFRCTMLFLRNSFAQLHLVYFIIRGASGSTMVIYQVVRMSHSSLISGRPELCRLLLRKDSTPKDGATEAKDTEQDFAPNYEASSTFPGFATPRMDANVARNSMTPHCHLRKLYSLTSEILNPPGHSFWNTWPGSYLQAALLSFRMFAIP